MNKKILSLVFLGILAIAVVSAYSAYFALITVHANVAEPIQVMNNGNWVTLNQVLLEEQTHSAYPNSPSLVAEIQINNLASVEEQIGISPTIISNNTVGEWGFDRIEIVNPETGEVIKSVVNIVNGGIDYLDVPAGESLIKVFATDSTGTEDDVLYANIMLFGAVKTSS